MHWDGIACMCNAGTSYSSNTDQCEPDGPTCGGNMVPDTNGGCTCPTGMSWTTGDNCVCNTGTHLEGSACVADPEEPGCPGG